MSAIKIKFEGGPLDNIILVIEDCLEYKSLEPKPISPADPWNTTIKTAWVEHIYKKSTIDPHIFWYAGSKDC